MRTASPLVGCAIGDALGVPWEMSNFDNPTLQGWDGTYWVSVNHPFMQGAGQPGQWSDDTQMSLALAASIIDQDDYAPEIAAQFYHNIFEGGRGAVAIAGGPSSTGIRGIGRATRAALEKLHNNIPWWKAGTRDAVGNGTLMRVSPLGIVYRKDMTTLIEAAELDARITHNGIVAIEASRLGALMVALLSHKVQPLEAMKELLKYKWVTPLGQGLQDMIALFEQPLPQLKDPSLGPWRIQYQQAIGVTGHATSTAIRCLFLLGSTNNFEDAVTFAVRGGGDADTAAAIVGSWAATLYGEPEQKYLTELEEVARLQHYDAKLWALGE